MYRILLLSAIGMLMLFAQCANEPEPTTPEPVVAPKPEPAPVTKGTNAISFPEDGYQKYDPVTFIAYLQENAASGTVILDKAPDNWIQKKHLKTLIKLVDSTEPCAGITLRNSGPNPPDNVQSCVGAEVLMILESYKQKTAYPAVASSLNFIKILQKSPHDNSKLILIPQPYQLEEAKAWVEKL